MKSFLSNFSPLLCPSPHHLFVPTHPFTPLQDIPPLPSMSPYRPNAIPPPPPLSLWSPLICPPLNEESAPSPGSPLLSNLYGGFPTCTGSQPKGAPRGCHTRLRASFQRVTHNTRGSGRILCTQNQPCPKTDDWETVSVLHYGAVSYEMYIYSPGPTPYAARARGAEFTTILYTTDTGTRSMVQSPRR